MKYPDAVDPTPVPLVMVGREEWGAVPPQGETVPLEHPVDYIWLRESPLTPPCLNAERCVKAVQTLQQRDMGKPAYPDIQANFLIGDDGRVYEGRGWFTKPEKNAKWEKYDGQYIEIAYIGPFEGIPFANSQKMLRQVLNLMKVGEEKRYMLERHSMYLLGDPPDFLE